jgi:hypothetical protein
VPVHPWSPGLLSLAAERSIRRRAERGRGGRNPSDGHLAGQGALHHLAMIADRNRKETAAMDMGPGDAENRPAMSAHRLRAAADLLAGRPLQRNPAGLRRGDFKPRASQGARREMKESGSARLLPITRRAAKPKRERAAEAADQRETAAERIRKCAAKVATLSFRASKQFD